MFEEHYEDLYLESCKGRNEFIKAVFDSLEEEVTLEELEEINNLIDGSF